MLIDTFMCEYGFLSVPTPYLSPYGYPNDVPVGQEMVEQTNVLIPWYPISYLTIAGYGFFFWALTGPYPTLRFGGACGLGVGATTANRACRNPPINYHQW